MIAPWDEMNQKFRAHYARARDAALAKDTPLVLLKENKIILLRDDKREEFNIIEPKYSLLKSIAHIPLALFVMIHSSVDAPLSEEKLTELKDFRDTFIKASSNLEQWQLSSRALGRQKQLLQSSSTLIDNAVKTGSVDRPILLAYCRDMGPLVLENAYEATSLELENVDRRMKQWQSSMTEEQWRKLRVIILSGHMPRQENRMLQYFEKLFKEKQEGKRIVYAEGCNEEGYAKELLGTHILDRDVAIYFFKDEWRMHRDLLSDAAKRYLKTHKQLK